MPGVSEYERSINRAALAPDPARNIERGVGLFVTAMSPAADLLHEAAVLPAMRANRLNLRQVGVAFDDSAALADVCRGVQTAEVVVIDLSDLVAPVMYVLGLCHGVGRCPILIARARTVLPFNLVALHVEFFDATSTQGIAILRSKLAGRLRVFLRSTTGPPID